MKSIDTGLDISILPIGIKQLKKYRPERDLLIPFVKPGEKELIQYASFANLFSGGYRIFAEVKDKGFKPILAPTRNKQGIKLQLEFPFEISREFRGCYSSYEPSNEDWKPEQYNSLILFGKFSFEKEKMAVRIYLSNKKKNNLLEKMHLDKPDLRRDYNFRMYDANVEKQNGRFILKNWQ